MDAKNRSGLKVVALLLLAWTAACSDQGIAGLAGDSDLAELAPAAVVASFENQADDQACWGQATQVFARAGLMGEHASYYDTPRVGLRNLARQLYEAGLIEDDSMQALGKFVSVDIDACL